jgi:nitronate monooxygenase
VTEECPASAGTKSVMISTTDGGISTIKYYIILNTRPECAFFYRSTVHDTIKGTKDIWPVQYDGRAIIGDSYKDFVAGHEKEEVMQKHKTAMECDDATRKVIWAYVSLFYVKIHFE